MYFGRTLARAAGAHVQFWTSDINHLPTAPDTYDLITCTGVLHGLTRPVTAINELYRTLAPGGHAWVFDPATLEYESGIEQHLTPHERSIWQDHIESRDSGLPETYTPDEATTILADTQFTDYSTKQGSDGDLRLYLTK
jgi:SAM-dependent methyltransferase